MLEFLDLGLSDLVTVHSPPHPFAESAFFTERLNSPDRYAKPLCCLFGAEGFHDALDYKPLDGKFGSVIKYTLANIYMEVTK